MRAHVAEIHGQTRQRARGHVNEVVRTGKGTQCRVRTRARPPRRSSARQISFRAVHVPPTCAPADRAPTFSFSARLSSLRRSSTGPPPDWEQQLSAVTSVLENLQATVNSSTVLDASSTSELKQQQLNLKLKAKVREQKLQKQVEELQEELAAARKSTEVRRTPLQPVEQLWTPV